MVRTGSDYAVGYILDYSGIAAKANRVVLGAGPIRGRRESRHPTSRYRRIIPSKSVDDVMHYEQDGRRVPVRVVPRRFARTKTWARVEVKVHKRSQIDAVPSS